MTGANVAVDVNGEACHQSQDCGVEDAEDE